MLLDQIRNFIDYNQYNFPEVAVFILGYLACMWLGIVIWVWRDITIRSRNPLAAALAIPLVLFGNILGLILYLLLRPARTLEEEQQAQLVEQSVIDENITACPECHAMIRQGYTHCPTCGAKAEVHCEQCHNRINPGWNFCTFCGTDTRPTPLRVRLWSRVTSSVSETAQRIRTSVSQNWIKLRGLRVRVKLPRIKFPRRTVANVAAKVEEKKVVSKTKKKKNKRPR